MTLVFKTPARALTIGDPTGIGPEITVRFLTERMSSSKPLPVLHVFGNIDHLRQTADALGVLLPLETEHLAYHTITGSPGDVAYYSVVQAVQAIHRGEVGGLVTGPISKQALHAAGYAYEGHTELLEYLAQTLWKHSGSADMLFVHQDFRLLLLTRHLPLAAVSKALSLDRVTKALYALVTCLQHQLGLSRPRVVIMGLNPHAGEVGGHEERSCLIPAMQAVARQTGAILEGPVAADALFRGFRQPVWDAYVACYHDQGLIPMKLIAGMQAVNVTIGLPFLRTSVSHGTAPDIVGHGIASPASLTAADALLTDWLRRGHAASAVV